MVVRAAIEKIGRDMTTITLTLTMPDQLAEEAEKAGLLSSSTLLQLIRQEVRQRRIESLFLAADRLAAVDATPLSADEIAAEIAAVRRERRANYASGS